MILKKHCYVLTSKEQNLLLCMSGVGWSVGQLVKSFQKEYIYSPIVLRKSCTWGDAAYINLLNRRLITGMSLSKDNFSLTIYRSSC